MKARRFSLCALVTVVAATHAHADQVVNDDQIVQGAACVGLDCVNGESFDGDELKIKENNLRIRFEDTSVAPGLGQSWNLEANSSRNGGVPYLDFQVKSLDANTPLVVGAGAKDALVPEYDCSGTTAFEHDPFGDPFSALLTGNSIPVGDAVLAPDASTLTCTSFPNDCTVQCAQQIGYDVRSLLTLGTGDPNEPVLGNGVAVGFESAAESGVVSVGRADLARRIVNLAQGLADTDALTRAELTSPRVASLTQQVDQVTAELDEIEGQILILESIADECPCEGPSGAGSTWKNHGKYLACVSQTAQELARAGLISGAAKGDITSRAARSACGKAARR